MDRRFRYLRDPLFLAGAGLYLANRCLVRPSIEPPSFFHSHLNDLLCIPFWLPPALLLERKLRIRRHDGPPGPGEIAVHLAVWSIAFEGIAPRLPVFAGTVADPLDILAYAAGALAAAVIWLLPACRAHGRPGRGTVWGTGTGGSDQK